MYQRTIDAESSVIGSVLIEPCCLADVLEYVNPDDFQSVICGDTLRVASRLFNEGSAVDPVTIRSGLEARYGEKETTDFLVGCMDITPTVVNVIEYCKIVKQKSMLRKLVVIGDDMRYTCAAEESAWQVIAADFMGRVQGLCDEDNHTALIGGGDWLDKFIAEENAIIENPEAAFCKTGYRHLDEELGGGMFRAGLYIIGARPGMGKTTLAINVAENIARRGKNILFISLEMSDTQIMCKRIAADTGVSYTAIMSGRMTDGEKEQMRESAKKLTARGLFINRKAGLTVGDIVLLAQKVRGVDVVMVDYLGLIRPSNSTGSRYEDYTNISGELKRLAMKLNVPVVALSQLNRANTQRESKRPGLADLRDTGAIEQDADAVILLHREEYYKREQGEKNPDAEQIELIIAKNRHGNTGTVNMTWEGKCGRIGSIEYFREEPISRTAVSQKELQYNDLLG